MSDIEFIKFLCKELWQLATDGNEPDMNKIEDELNKRHIDPDDIFVY